jgi:hypothetical protein
MPSGVHEKHRVKPATLKAKLAEDAAKLAPLQTWPEGPAPWPRCQQGIEFTPPVAGCLLSRLPGDEAKATLDPGQYLQRLSCLLAPNRVWD